MSQMASPYIKERIQDLEDLSNHLLQVLLGKPVVPAVLGVRRTPCPVSVGVVVMESWGGVPSADAVLRRADQAMFHAKRDGGGVHRYDPDEPAPFDDDWFEGRR